MKLKIYTLLLLISISLSGIQAQDYQISFAGSGAITTVTTVKVENLTQGTELTMNGSDILHLKNIITGIESYGEDINQKISFSPNPMTDYSLIKFYLPEDGQTTISLFEITGRKLLEVQDYLNRGQQTFRIQGIDNGVYIVKIVSNRYSVSGRLLSSGFRKGDPKITHEDAVTAEKMGNDSKGISAETVMQYNSGDRLKMTGISDIYSTVVTDVPTESKTITFTFIDCIDASDNYYPIVQIGTQTWMAENLKTTMYYDLVNYNRVIIPNISDQTFWSNLTTPSYCLYNNMTENKNIYGILYNWFTVNSGNLCPIGWHLPSISEWQILETNLGGNMVAGGKLKETGTNHWVNPNTGATNESGFTGLPGGARGNDGSFYNLYVDGYWWSSTEESSDYAKLCILSNGTGRFFTDVISRKKDGLSVRCVKGEIPNVETVAAIEITSSRAILRGNINPNGSSTSVTFEYGKTTSYSKSISANQSPVTGTNPVEVSVELTDLDPQTTYHYRVKAINLDGPAYGIDLSFTTDPSTVSDIDGNVYNIIRIGSQLWMKENLKTTNYNDNSPITLELSNTNWSTISSEAFCWYNNDPATYKNLYGALYNGYSVTTNKLCPVGWHVPTNTEWAIMVNYLGGEYVASGKLKEVGTVHWLSPNSDATNSSGFTALPAGCRSYYDGSYKEIGLSTGWWTSSGSSGIELVTSDGRAYWSNYGSRHGYSIRCIKDN